MPAHSTDLYYKNVEGILQSLSAVHGMLRPKELKFLIMATLYPTAKGELLEIGSFKGLSTIALAKAASLTDNPIVHATDPLIFSAVFPQTAENGATSADDFYANLKTHGVEDQVRFTRQFSYDLAKTWNQTIRMLWIDGDHSYKGVKEDIRMFEPHLAPGAIVLSHDIVGEHEGGIRAWCDCVLDSDLYGAAGCCGSIAWAQYIGRPTETERRNKQTLKHKLLRMNRYTCYGQKKFNPVRKTVEKLLFKYTRAQVPHGEIRPEEWLSQLRTAR